MSKTGKIQTHIAKLKNPIWDGTYLGKLCKEMIIDKRKTNQGTYWKIRFHSVTTWCLVKKSMDKSVEQCIIDEIKPLFKLRKLGTNWAFKNQTKYVLINPYKIESDGFQQLKDYPTLSKLKLQSNQNQDTIKSIQKIYAFRLALGIKNHNKQMISLKSGNNNPRQFYLICFNARSFEKSLNKNVLNKSIFEKYFHSNNNSDSVDPGMIIKKILDIKSDNELPKKMFHLRNIIRNIINRIDPDSILILETMMFRLTRILISCD